MIRGTATISSIILITVAVFFASNFSSKLISKNDWWCAPEHHYTGWSKKPDFVAYTDLLANQQKVADEWLLTIQKKDNPKQSVELWNQNAQAAIHNIRFACAHKNTHECRVIGCDSDAY